MTIPASGPVDFFRLKTEFKPSASNTSISLGQLYSGGSYVKGGGFLGIPTSGTIGINNFQGTYNRWLSAGSDVKENGSYTDGAGNGYDVGYTGFVPQVKPISDKFGNVYHAGLHHEGAVSGWAVTPKRVGIVKKYNTSGDYVYTKTLVGSVDGQTDNPAVKGLCLNSVGELIVAHEGTNHTTGLASQTVVKLDSDGNLIWTNTVSAPTAIFTYGLQVDSSDNIYVFGSYVAPGNIKTITIRKINSDGTTLWSNSASNSTLGYQELKEGVTSSNGNSYALARMTDKSTVLKWNSSGVLQWVKNISLYSTSYEAQSICLDSSENIYVMDHYNKNVVITKINSSGTTIDWSNIYTPSLSGHFMDTGYTGRLSMVVDKNNNIYFAQEILHSNSSYWHTIFITKLNSSGAVQWASNIGTEHPSTGSDSGAISRPSLGFEDFSNNLLIHITFMHHLYSDEYGQIFGNCAPALMKVPSHQALPTGTYTNSGITVGDTNTNFVIQNFTQTVTAQSVTFDNFTDGTETTGTFTPSTTTPLLITWQSKLPYSRIMVKI